MPEDELVLKPPELYYIYSFDLFGMKKGPELGVFNLNFIKDALQERDVPFFSIQTPFVKKIHHLVAGDKNFSGEKIAAEVNKFSKKKFIWKGPITLTKKNTFITKDDLHIMSFYLVRERTDVIENVAREIILQISKKVQYAINLLETLPTEELTLKKGRKRNKIYVIGEFKRRFLNMIREIAYLPTMDRNDDIFQILFEEKLNLGNSRKKIRLIEVVTNIDSPKNINHAFEYFENIDQFILKATEIIQRVITIIMLTHPNPEPELLKKVRELEDFVLAYAKRIKYFDDIEFDSRKNEQSFSEEFSKRYLPLKITLSRLHQNTARITDVQLSIVQSIEKIMINQKKKHANIEEIAQVSGIELWSVESNLNEMFSRDIIIKVKKDHYTTHKGIQYIAWSEKKLFWDIISIKSDHVGIYNPEFRLSSEGIVSLRLRVKPIEQEFTIAKLARFEGRLYEKMLSIATNAWKTFAFCWNDCIDKDASIKLPFKLNKLIKITKSGAVYKKEDSSQKEVIYHKFTMRFFSDQNLTLDQISDSEKNKQIIGLARSSATAWREYRPQFIETILAKDLAYTSKEIVILTEKGLLLNMPHTEGNPEYRGFVDDMLLVMEILGMRKCSLSKIDKEIDVLLMEHTTALKKITELEELEKLRGQFFDITKTKTKLVDAIKIDRHVHSSLLLDLVNEGKEAFWIDSLKASIKEKINDLDSLVQSTYTMELREKNVELADQFVNIFDEMRLMQGTLEILAIFIIFVYFAHFGEILTQPFEMLVSGQVPTSEAIMKFIQVLAPALIGVLFGIEYIRHGRTWIIKKHVKNLLITENGEMKKKDLIDRLLTTMAHESELFIGVVEIVLRPLERFSLTAKPARQLRQYLCTSGLIKEIEKILHHEHDFKEIEIDGEPFIKMVG